MKKHINLFILFLGVSIAIADFITGYTRCIIVGLSLILFSYLNSKIKYIRLLIPKTIVLTTMYWIIRFSLVSISINLNFYQFILTKFFILGFLLFFFLLKFPHHPYKFYRSYVFVIFLIINLFFDLIITYRFDSAIFSDPFFYITLTPILFLANDKISYVSKQSSASNSQRFS